VDPATGRGCAALPHATRLLHGGPPSLKPTPPTAMATIMLGGGGIISHCPCSAINIILLLFFMKYTRKVFSLSPGPKNQQAKQGEGSKRDMEEEGRQQRTQRRGPIVGLSPQAGSKRAAAEEEEGAGARGVVPEREQVPTRSKRPRSTSREREAAEQVSTISTSRTSHSPSPSPASPRPVPPRAGLPVVVAAMRSCRSVDHYERLNRIQEGAYGVVRTHPPPQFSFARSKPRPLATLVLQGL
jgi:hypothetical protein